MGSRVAIFLLLFTVGCATQDQRPAPASAPWLGVFTALPGARQLCYQHVSAGTADKRIEITFTLYATTRPTAEVIRFYADAHKVPVVAGAPFEVRIDGDHKILSVHGIADHYPSCDVAPNPQEPTVIMVAEMVSGPKDPVK
jgi:hypothetical protein